MRRWKNLSRSRDIKLTQPDKLIELTAMAKKNGNGERVKSMGSWIWDAACSIRKSKITN